MVQERQWWPGLAAAQLKGKQMYSRDIQEVGRLGRQDLFAFGR